MADKRTIVITGASDGIGAVAARELAGDDVDLIVVGRSREKTEAVAAQTGATWFAADYARFDDVRKLADEIARHTGSVDVLLNNAGGTFSPSQRTADGHEPNFQINHLSGFLLTTLLKDRLSADGGALVVNTSSFGNLAGSVDLTDLDYNRRRPFELRCYGTSKLENIMFTRGIAERWSDDGIVSAAVHPGVVASSFGRDSAFIGLFYRTPLKRVGTITPEQGAQPLVALARRGADPAINGVYFNRLKPNGLQNKQARRRDLVDGLWEASEKLVGEAGAR